jgi:quinol monooxygenase YgiN
MERTAVMVGFEILVIVSPNKHQEFIQACELLSDAAYRNSACIGQALYEHVKEADQFLWVEHWNDLKEMDAYLKSSRFGVLLGAISVLGESKQPIRLKTQSADGVKSLKTMEPRQL